MIVIPPRKSDESVTFGPQDIPELGSVTDTDSEAFVRWHKFIHQLLYDVRAIARKLDERDQSISELERDALTRKLIYEGFRVGWHFYRTQFKELGGLVSVLFEQLDRRGMPLLHDDLRSEDVELNALVRSIQRLIEVD